jgi:hypothetical protein
MSYIKPFLGAALTVPISVLSLRWDSRLLQKDELPEELKKNEKMVLIYLLPKVFQSLNFKMASFYSSLWLYGKGTLGSISVDKSTPKTLNYWQCKIEAFNESPTVKYTIEKWLRLSEQQTPIYKWKPGGFTKVQSCPRRRRLRRTDAVGNSGRTTKLVFYAACASVGMSKP